MKIKQRISLLLAWFAIGIAVAAIYGNLANHPQLASWSPDTNTMAISSGVAIICLAVSSLLNRHEFRDK